MDGSAVAAIIAIVLALMLGAWIQANRDVREATTTTADQRACGTDPAIHGWRQHGRRLVVCERESGLVVREVLP